MPYDTKHNQNATKRILLSPEDLDNNSNLREMMKAVKTSGNCKSKIRLIPLSTPIKPIHNMNSNQI